MNSLRCIYIFAWKGSISKVAKFVTLQILIFANSLNTDRMQKYKGTPCR